MDARIADRAVTDPALDELSDRAFRVWTMALAWSAGQDADGRIPRRALRLLHPEGEGVEAAAELVAAGVWRESRDGFTNVLGQDWQTTASDAQALREKNAERARRYRERKRDASREHHAGEDPDVTGTITPPSRPVGAVDNSEAAAVGEPCPNVTGDVTRDASRDGVGEARRGEASPEGEVQEGEGQGSADVIDGIAQQVPAARSSPALPGAVKTALAAGWQPSDVLAAVRTEVGPNGGPGVVVNVVRGLAARPSPASARAAKDRARGAQAAREWEALCQQVGEADAHRLTTEAAAVLTDARGETVPADSRAAIREAQMNANQHEHADATA